MRGVVLIGCYVLAIGVGFMLRGRYDMWMFSKHHMQARYRVLAAEAAADPDPVGQTLYFPPSTTDELALSAARTRVWLEQYSALSQGEPGIAPGSPAAAAAAEESVLLSGSPPETAGPPDSSPPSRPIEPA